MFFTSLAQSVYDGSIIYNKNKKYNEGNISNSIGLNNSSMEPIALQLNHNDKHESISVPFKAGKNDTTNKIINISLKSTVKHSNAKNCFYNIRILDYICFYFLFRKNKSKLLISFSREYIKKALSCEEIIKTRINQLKTQSVIEENRKGLLSQIAPDFILQFEKSTYV